MFNIVLHEPQIPPNTGNVMRLASNTGCQLHLVEPMGFTLDDKRMRRAGLDYREFSDVKVWPSITELMSKLDLQNTSTDPHGRCYMFSTHHQTLYSDANYSANDFLIFGAETHGLPIEIRESVPKNQRLRLPMMAGNRSLNLSNSVAIVVYEAWRQAGFKGSSDLQR